MSVTMRLVHRTGYTYTGPATQSYNEARLTPLSSALQTVLHSRVDVTPTPWMEQWTDYWGTTVTSFELHEPHDELKVVAISTVTVDRHLVETTGMGWQQYADPSVRDEFEEVLRIVPRTAPSAAFADVVAQVRENSATPAAFVTDVIAAIRERLDYVAGRRTVYARCAGAWDDAEGACQDFAHLTLGALRSQGIPARFVTGYVFPDRDAPVGANVTGVSHAWIQWWDGAWTAVDPSAGVVPDDFYIEVAQGRDHSDVVPLRGIFTGTPGSKMFVTVEISRLA